jgi:hypothetical protein
MNIIYLTEGGAYLDQLAPDLANYIRRSIFALADVSECQMVIQGMTVRLADHIYRVFKLYGRSPGFRVIFYFETGDTIIIETIARRDEDPYQNGN